MTIGIIPAAGIGSRIQPLAFSKELLPVGSRADGPPDRPRAVSEYIVERMVLGGATTICFVIAPNKHDTHDAAFAQESAVGVPIQHCGHETFLKSIQLHAGIPQARDLDDGLRPQTKARASGQAQEIDPFRGHIFANVALRHRKASFA